VNVSGGTGPYTYSWAPAGGTGATAQISQQEPIRLPYMTIAGCVTTQQFTITQPTALTAAASGSNVNCNGGNNGTASVNAGGELHLSLMCGLRAVEQVSTASNLTAGLTP
jgi:hypothetical protein